MSGRHAIDIVGQRFGIDRHDPHARNSELNEAREYLERLSAVMRCPVDFAT